MSKRRRTPKVDAVPVTPPPTRTTWAVIGLIVAVLLTYANSFTHPFMFDDHGTVVENAQIRDLGHLARVMSPPAETPVGGRPLVNLSFALNYASGGLNPIGYRVVNLALHLACGLLIFGLVRRTLEYEPGGTEPRRRAPYVAFAVALLWLVHPLNSEVVDYVSERTESMMAVCYLLTLYAAARAHDATSRLRPAAWMAAAIAACAAGMACKESMVTAPLMVVAYDRAFVYDSFRAAFRARGRFYVGLAATWIVLAVLMASHPRTLGNGFSTTIISPWTYLWNQMQMVTHYLRLAIWPDALTLNYGWPRAIGPADVWPYALLLVALLAVAVRLSWRRPRIAFLVTFFVVTLAPASSIVPVGAEVGAERRMYLPLAALLALGVVGVYSFLVPRSSFLVPFSFGRRNGERGTSSAERDRNAERGTRNAERERNAERGTRNEERITATLMLLVAAALGVRTFARNAEYSSPLVMARTVLARWPTPAAEHLVGTELVRAGDPDEAMLHLRTAAPGYPPAHYNLGVELVKRGQSEEGLAELQTFIREEPDMATVRDARLAMSRAFEDLHQPGKAIEQLQLVLAASPGDASAHGMLADVLAGAQQFEAAIREYRALLAVRTDNAAGWSGLGVASIATGRPDDAIAAFRRAVAAEPQHAGYRENLARALLDRGDVDEAASHVQEALRLAPGDAAAHELSGRILESRHDLDGARAEFTTALRLDPSYVPAQEGLRRVGRYPLPGRGSVYSLR